MMRAGWGAFALALVALAGAAHAQGGDQVYSVGARAVGAEHPLELTARNADCTQPLNFRFEFAPSPWLRPRGGAVVRGVRAGESRNLPALIDLTQMQPGHYTANVDVVCENCRFLFLRTCRIDRQRLTIAVDAVAPPPTVLPAPGPATRTPGRPGAGPTPEAQQAAPETPTSPQQPAADRQPTQMAEDTPAATGSEAAASACAEQMALLIAIAAAAALAALACAAWALNAANAARMAAKQTLGEDRSDDRRQLLGRRLDEYRALVENSRRQLDILLHAQFQAMRALSALSIADARQTARDAETWTRICRDAGYAINQAAASVARGRGEGSLQRVLESAARARSQGFPPFSGDARTAPASHKQQLNWLRSQGFVGDDAAAQAVLGEMANFVAFGCSMSNMNERLQEQLNECRRADAELAQLAAETGA